MADLLILDRYRPLANLGRGSHGHVVLAYDTRMARRVAMKRLELTPEDAAALRADNGLAEARTSAMLNHPNIVTVYDWDMSAAGDAYLIMEAIDGVSLSELLDDGGGLDPAQTAAVVADVAEALRFVHSNGVLHLDMKPENVMVTRDGLVKVADFGVSRLTDAGGTASAVAGTPGFMAPEQLIGEPVDERADVWALAALTYLMLTGDEPYPARTVPEAVRQLHGPEPDEPSRFDAELDADIDDVVLEGLDRDPVARFGSALEFADALLPLLPDLGDGREMLAADVETLLDDERAVEPAPPSEPLRLWDVVLEADRWLRHAAAAGAALGISYAGLTGFGLLSGAVSVAVAAVIALCAAVVPGLGLGLAFIAVSIGAFVQVGWAQGIALGITLGALWWVWGRAGRWELIAPLYEPLLAVFKLGAAGPALAGFFMRPARAAGASALASTLLMIASAGSGFGSPLLSVDPGLAFSPWTTFARHTTGMSALFHPTSLLIIAVWAGAGGAGSLIARRGTRTAGVVSVLASTGILLGGYLAWSTLRGFGITSGDLLPQFAASTALVVLVAIVGPPPLLADEPAFDDIYDAEE